ncbi:hypothetical protein [Streptomyces violaceus]|uniref:ComEC/Rec2-related protein domain-containing protein n=1 Tax=Streptomyces violaceus TaxID=1936 RepID=A0ABZ1NWB9_STRVL
MERPRSARLARGALLWAALTLPALTADRIGLNEPRTVWQQAAGVAVLAGAAGLSRRLPLAAFGLAAALSLAAARPCSLSSSCGRTTTSRCRCPRRRDPGATRRLRRGVRVPGVPGGAR